MKCRFAKFLFKAFGITGGALAVLFVITDIPKHSMSMWRATMTSGTVDIPTASPPITRIQLYSAGVSKDGPCSPAYTPFCNGMFNLFPASSAS